MAGMLTHAPFWLTVGGTSALPVAYIAQRIPLRMVIGTTLSGRIWRVIGLLFALANIKSLPFSWHLRLLKGLLPYVSFLRNRPPQAPSPAQLFQPIITSSHTSLLEMDYNFHKSNSTYFTDLDVARMNIVACVFARGMHRARFGAEGSGKRLEESGVPDPTAKLGIFLGGVTCSFRKELKPYVPFEIWTRVLAWDRKWIYIVSHIVKAGAVKPSEYTLQPWRNGKAAAAAAAAAAVSGIKLANGHPSNGQPSIHPNADPAAPVPHSAIIATSVAKYVFKRGKWTLPVEVALENSGLLPPRSEHVLSESELLALTDSNGTLWDWKRVQEECARGMEIAQHMAELDRLNFEFSGEGSPALARV